MELQQPSLDHEESRLRGHASTLKMRWQEPESLIASKLTHSEITWPPEFLLCAINLLLLFKTIWIELSVTWIRKLFDWHTMVSTATQTWGSWSHPDRSNRGEIHSWLAALLAFLGKLWLASYQLPEGKGPGQWDVFWHLGAKEEYLFYLKSSAFDVIHWVTHYKLVDTRLDVRTNTGVEQKQCVLWVPSLSLSPTPLLVPFPALSTVTSPSRWPFHRR